MPAAEPPRPPRSLRRFATEAFTQRLSYKAAALFMALVLWLVVSAEEPTEELVPVRLALVMDSTLELQSPQPAVHALIVGRGRELLKLYASPPVVRRVVAGDTPDTMRFEFQPSDVDLPSGVEAIVRDVQPRSLVLRITSVIERRVPVRSELAVTAASGLRLTGSPHFEPESVTVSGERKAVDAVDDVATVGRRVTVADTLPIQVPLDTARLGVRVYPAQVRLIVPVAPVAVDSASFDSLAQAAAPGATASGTRGTP